MIGDVKKFVTFFYGEDIRDLCIPYLTSYASELTYV